MEQYIQPFVDVTKTCFKDFCGVDLTVQRPYFEEADAVNQWDISAVIGLTGEARGAVVVSMKAGLACSLTKQLTQMEHTKIDDDVVDAVGEIVNIIAGNAKKGLEEEFRIVISLPTIVQGPGHQIKWPNKQARIICIPCSVGADTFTLSVAIDSVKAS
jgi:chemotaxis protein CheX